MVRSGNKLHLWCCWYVSEMFVLRVCHASFWMLVSGVDECAVAALSQTRSGIVRRVWNVSV